MAPWLTETPPLTLPEYPDWASPPFPMVGKEMPERAWRGAADTTAVLMITRAAKNEARMTNEDGLKWFEKTEVGGMRRKAVE